jgi:hypothetical protein
MAYPDFEEFIECLNAHRVRYLIVGGYAVAFHARPRATKEIDVLVDPMVANAKRTIVALGAFLGAPTPDITVECLTNPRTLIVLGVAPVRIDILTSISGMKSFAAAWKRRVQVQFGRTPAKYIALEDLIAARATRRVPRLAVGVPAAEQVETSRVAADSTRRIMTSGSRGARTCVVPAGAGTIRIETGTPRRPRIVHKTRLI